MKNPSVKKIINQIRKGIKVEKEHTKDPLTALKIAIDHIGENPAYYDKLANAGLEEGPTNAPGVASKPSSEENPESDITTATDLQVYLRDISKDSKNFRGLDAKEIKAIFDILNLILKKSSKGSTGPTLDAVSKIISQKTQSINEEDSLKDPKTYGDLKNLIKAITSGDKKKKIISKGKEIALDQFLGFIPGASNAKTFLDFLRTITKKPDTVKTDSILSQFDIDDNTLKIVDDAIENGFLNDLEKEIQKEPDDKELESDYNMNTKFANYLKAKYNDHFVAPQKNIQKNIQENIEEGECCPQCLSELIEECWSKPIEEAEYKGRKVPLGKPMKGDVKKFKVYVKNKKGNVIKVEFGQPGVKIKKNNPARRKSFRARHKCHTAKDRTTARYWSCRKW